jgi:hypothetical protein
VVRLKGQIIGGHGDTVFTLPIAFRPRHDVVESIYAAGDQGGTVLICGSQFKCAGQPGDVIVSDPHGSIPTNVAVSLDGVTFQAGE